MNKMRFIMFLIGLGSLTKVFVVGCLSISEMLVFLVAPFIFWKDYRQLRTDGYLLYLGLLSLSFLGMLTSSFFHHCEYVYIIKASAVIYSISAHVVVFHRILRKDTGSVGWFYVGALFSGIITIFAFNPRAYVSAGEGFGYIGEAEVEEVVSGSLFWVAKAESILELPLFTHYLSLPACYQFVVVGVLVVVAVTTTVSGRSAVLIVFIGAVLMTIGGKTTRSIRRMGKHIHVVLAIAILSVIVFKYLYSEAARKGYLSADAKEKYELQTRHGDSLLRLIISGRIEPFVGLRAALDSPIIGHGLSALDTKGYYLDFLEEYGDHSDVERFMKLTRYNEGGRIKIPSHSHIIGDWLSCGITGVIPWLYILYLMYNYFRKYAAAVPQLYGFLSLQCAFYAWHICFSPLGIRSNLALFVATLLAVRAIAKGKFLMPPPMIMELRKHESANP